MKASELDLIDFLGQNKIIYRIPVYQRNYEWTKTQIDKLFDDFINIIEDDYKTNHFIGAFVFTEHKVSADINERVIIDGQQRITTTMLIFKAIADIAKKQGDEELVEEITEYYLINKFAPEHLKNKLVLVKRDNAAYSELLKDKKTESKVYENYEYIKAKISNSRYSPREIYQAVKYVLIVAIALDREDNPQIIFESLNSTGLSLENADLIRNFILMGQDYETQTKLYEKYWMEIEKKLTNSNISEFIRHYLIMINNTFIRKQDTYEKFKTYFINSNQSSEWILDELKKYSSYYYSIMYSKSDDKDINNILTDINDAKATVSYPFLMEVFNDYQTKLIKKEEIVKTLEVIRSYLYRRSICNIPSNILNSVFAIMGRESKKNRELGLSYIRALEEFIMGRQGKGRMPRDEEFLQYFVNYSIYRNSGVITKNVLYSIETYKHKEVVIKEDLQIEHIMPQTLNSEWKVLLGKNATEIHEMYCNTFGNLTLTNYNSEMSNHVFEEKKKHYINSNISISRDLNRYKNWNKAEIIERANDMFKIGKEIWYLPKDSHKSTSNELSPFIDYSMTDNSIIVTGRKARSFKILGDEHVVDSWKELLVKTAKILADLDEELFTSLINKSIYDRRLVNEENKDKLRKGEEIINGIYLETNYSANSCLSLAALLASEFDLEDDVFFTVR